MKAYAHLWSYFTWRHMHIYDPPLNEGICTFMILLYMKAYAHIWSYFTWRHMHIYDPTLHEGICAFMILLYMKAYAHLWSYFSWSNARLWLCVAEFFLEWEVFHTDVEKIKTHFLCSITLQIRTLYKTVWTNVEYTRQATDDNVIRCVHVACWLSKSTNTHS